MSLIKKLTGIRTLAGIALIVMGCGENYPNYHVSTYLKRWREYDVIVRDYSHKSGGPKALRKMTLTAFYPDTKPTRIIGEDFGNDGTYQKIEVYKDSRDPYNPSFRYSDFGFRPNTPECRAEIEKCEAFLDAAEMWVVPSQDWIWSHADSVQKN